MPEPTATTVRYGPIPVLPAILGNPTSTTRVISIAAYEARSVETNDSKASTIALIMAAIELLVITIVLYGRGRLYRGSTGGKG